MQIYMGNSFKNVNFATKIEILRLYSKKGKEKSAATAV